MTINAITGFEPITLENNNVLQLHNNKKVENNQENFTNVIGKILDGVNETQVKADNNIEKFIKGEDVAVHDVMISMQEAEMSMQMLLQMRNQIVEAYQELNRITL